MVSSPLHSMSETGGICNISSDRQHGGLLPMHVHSSETSSKHCQAGCCCCASCCGNGAPSHPGSGRQSAKIWPWERLAARSPADSKRPFTKACRYTQPNFAQACPDPAAAGRQVGLGSNAVRGKPYQASSMAKILCASLAWLQGCWSSGNKTTGSVPMWELAGKPQASFIGRVFCQLHP